MSRKNLGVAAAVVTLAATAGAFGAPAAQAEPCVGGDTPFGFCVNKPELEVISDPPWYCLHAGGEWVCPPDWD